MIEAIKDTENKTRELIDTTPFSVSARVAMQLGRESISSSVTAILELVKNAYDADADVVRIRFAGLDTATPRMIVEDDGKGMSAKELKDNWMVIGTANKVDAGRSKSKGRILTGEKGLGRLGLDRLCIRTRVQSIILGGKDAVELDVDWLKYEQTTSRLEEVSHPLFKISSLEIDPLTGEARAYPKGTRLILDGLKDRWDEAAIAELYGELSLLISPFSETNDFRVELDTGGAFSKFDGVIASDATIVAGAYWKVVGIIDEHGMVEIRMSSMLRETEYHQRSTPWSEFVKGEGLVPECGPLKFEFYFFHRGELNAPGQSLTLPKLNQFMQSNQGIRIYRDGFRVKPYGEPNGEGDWLRLGYRRTINPEGVKMIGNWKLGYNQVVGAVFLSRETNQALIDQTNREGLVIGTGFRHLYIFAEKVLTFFEKHHQKFERSRVEPLHQIPELPTNTEESAAAADAALQQLANLTQKIDLLLSPTPGDSPPSREQIGQNLGAVNQTLSRAVKALEENAKQESTRRVQTELEKNTLANLASLGILTACFGHETCGWANTVRGNALWLGRNLESNLFMVTPDVRELVMQVLTDLGVDASKLHTFAEFALGNVRPYKRRRREFCVKEVALNVFAAFRESLQQQKHIETDLSNIPVHQCLIVGYQIDWESIFANLVTNAMWAVTQHQGQRKVSFSIIEDDMHFNLIFDDNGFGLEAGTEERIFEAGFSTKRNHKGEQEGTGMGLYIVKSFVVDNSGGTVQAISKGPLGGARFILTVPKAKTGVNGNK
jgi:hypothetical protein